MKRETGTMRVGWVASFLLAALVLIGGGVAAVFGDTVRKNACEKEYKVTRKCLPDCLNEKKVKDYYDKEYSTGKSGTWGPYNNCADGASNGIIAGLDQTRPKCCEDEKLKDLRQGPLFEQPNYPKSEYSPYWLKFGYFSYVLTMDDTAQTEGVLIYNFEVRERACGVLCMSVGNAIKGDWLYTYTIKNDRGVIIEKKRVLVSQLIGGRVDAGFDCGTVIGYLDKGKYDIEIIFSQELLSDLKRTGNEVVLALPHVIDSVLGLGVEIRRRKIKPILSRQFFDSWQSRCADAKMLAGNQTRVAFDRLLDLLVDPHPDVSYAAAEGLQERYEADLSALLKVVAGMPYDRRWYAYKMLSAHPQKEVLIFLINAQLTEAALIREGHPFDSRNLYYMGKSIEQIVEKLEECGGSILPKNR